VLPAWTIVGFTGHRHLKDSQVVAGAIRSALDELEKTRCALSGICSTAIGADTLFLEEIARRNLPYFLIFPFPAERFEKDFKPDEWAHVAAYFGGALDIEQVRGVDTDNEAYLECGVRTVDRCDVLMAVWDGQPAAGQGGTGDIVNYARELNKPLIWIDPHTGTFTQERMDQLKECKPAVKAAASPSAAISQR
jgi:hypothetical protein